MRPAISWTLFREPNRDNDKTTTGSRYWRDFTVWFTNLDLTEMEKLLTSWNKHESLIGNNLNISVLCWIPFWQKNRSQQLPRQKHGSQQHRRAACAPLPHWHTVRRGWVKCRLWRYVPSEKSQNHTKDDWPFSGQQTFNFVTRTQLQGKSFHQKPTHKQPIT